MNAILESQTATNNKLSQRFIELDPGGYFLIFLDQEAGLICAEHYSNTINDKGLATDPDTGKPLSCNGSLKRQPTACFKAQTAKELCIQIFEASQTISVTKLDHAAYLGREFVRAEMALASSTDYVQD
jgi:dihydropteroate synthase